MTTDPEDDGSGPGALVYLVNPAAHKRDRLYVAEIECPPIHDGCGWRSRVMPLHAAHIIRPLHACHSPAPALAEVTIHRNEELPRSQKPSSRC